MALHCSNILEAVCSNQESKSLREDVKRIAFRSLRTKYRNGVLKCEFDTRNAPPLTGIGDISKRYPSMLFRYTFNVVDDPCDENSAGRCLLLNGACRMLFKGSGNTLNMLEKRLDIIWRTEMYIG